MYAVEENGNNSQLPGTFVRSEDQPPKGEDDQAVRECYENVGLAYDSTRKSVGALV